MADAISKNEIEEKELLLKRSSIVKLAIVSEFSLIIIFFIWLFAFKENGRFEVSKFFELQSLLLGTLAALPLLLINILIPKYLACYFQRILPHNIYNQFTEFQKTIVTPLAKTLDIPSAILVSILAGAGEELFFRGLLLEELGIIISSLLFAVLHFGGHLKKFYAVVLIYFIFGLYFAMLKVYSGGFAIPVICHFIYDLLIIIYINKSK